MMRRDWACTTEILGPIRKAIGHTEQDESF